MGKLIDLTGNRYKKLVVVALSHKKDNRIYYWLCRCDCGNETVVRGSELKNGNTKSCGCLKGESNIRYKTKHNLTKTRIYRIWTMMKNRCSNYGGSAYKYYGGRGITVCDEWLHDFQAFYDWAMANGYRENLSIDRINVNGNYEPSNCRWATPKEQANNRRPRNLITHNNKTQTLKQWASELNMPYSTLYRRLYILGWTVEKSLTSKTRCKNGGN